MDITPLFRHRTPWFGSALLIGIALGALDGCDPNIAEQCGLDVNCEAGGFVEGKASISGVASIDSFFGAAIDLNAAMLNLSGKLRAELDAIGASVGAEPGASGAEIQGKLEAHLAVYVDGSLTIDYQPAKCEASVEAGISAAAECDAEVDPGSVSAKCSGSCEAEAGVNASCTADATLVCTGTAPNLICNGVCSGSCATEISGTAECSGTCRGTCDGMDDFEGRCNGECEGECVFEASAETGCDGKCEGSCEYRPGDAGCQADASARCEAMANASIECDAGCEGTVDPPQVSAECEATVDAKAKASIECTPPTLTFGFEWNADALARPELQAEFRAWLEGFRVHFGALVAARTEAELVGEAALALVGSADGALKAAVDDIKANGELKAAFGAKCALVELPIAAEALRSSSAELTANASAAVDVVGAF